MGNVDEKCEAIIGRVALELWFRFPRDVQEMIFEIAVEGNDELRQSLAVFLHDRHPRTAYPVKPDDKSQPVVGGSLDQKN